MPCQSEWNELKLMNSTWLKRKFKISFQQKTRSKTKTVKMKSSNTPFLSLCLFSCGFPLLLPLSLCLCAGLNWHQHWKAQLKRVLMLHKLQTQSLFSRTAMDRPCWGRADFFTLLLTGLYLTFSRAECEMKCPPNNKKIKWLCSSCLSYWWKFTQTLWPLMRSIWLVLCMHGTAAFGAQTWSNKHLAPLKFTSSNVVILHTIEWKSTNRHRVQGYHVYSRFQ